jgi:hypothetical protein
MCARVRDERVVAWRGAVVDCPTGHGAPRAGPAAPASCKDDTDRRTAL